MLNEKYFCTPTKQILEYYKDLKYWYKEAYANKLNGDMACQLMKDVKETFEETKIHGAFYFSHSEALLPFLTLLGLYKDNFTLTHDIYGEQIVANRKYKSSRIGPFSQNIGFVFLDCEEDNNLAQHRILTLHQEKIVKLDKCNEEACDWEEFKNAYQVRMQTIMY